MSAVISEEVERRNKIRVANNTAHVPLNTANVFILPFGRKLTNDKAKVGMAEISPDTGNEILNGLRILVDPRIAPVALPLVPEYGVKSVSVSRIGELLEGLLNRAN